ncbi:hypothetical protein BD410DRAFT_781002 [Rickenella mellea]|uniref:Elongator complex protein 5 n=1 Tax=Rickenella mellea TaxID=50990 RepID=A0A4Y7QML6_9AGAM|nr:hypothetical protein BD410DRAFT_781002 [Rickenella mellea]
MSLMLLKTRTAPSRLICHVNCPSELVHVLTQIAFSPSLVQIVARPPVLLTHIAQVYLTPPPPASTPEKFWRVFSPFAEREQDVESLVFGTGAEGGGGGGSSDEFVVEMLVRSGGEGKRKNVERSIEGWSEAKNGPCELCDLDTLKNVWTRPRSIPDLKEASIDPTQGLPFNLSLTPAQVELRSLVPLPYAYDGQRQTEKSKPPSGQILYDPDSADDIDEEDPDEDLDI